MMYRPGNADEKYDAPPKTVVELRARIEEGKRIAAQRLADHAADPSQPKVSRDVCRILAERMGKR